MNVEAWLTELGLEQYAKAFAENGVDLNLLPELTNEDLKDLGVDRLVGQRRPGRLRGARCASSGFLERPIR